MNCVEGVRCSRTCGSQNPDPGNALSQDDVGGHHRSGQVSIIRHELGSITYFECYVETIDDVGIVNQYGDS